MKNWVAYTDGSCLRNPGPGGWAFYIEGAETPVEGSGAIAHTTNQQMEVLAATKAMLELECLAGAGDRITLISDSQYVLKGLFEWSTGWIRNGWQNAAGKPVANRERWEDAIAALDGLRQKGCSIKGQWVKGHAGTPGNERVDQEAQRMARMQLEGEPAGIPERPRPDPSPLPREPEADLMLHLRATLPYLPKLPHLEVHIEALRRAAFPEADNGPVADDPSP